MHLGDVGSALARAAALICTLCAITLTVGIATASADVACTSTLKTTTVKGNLEVPTGKFCAVFGSSITGNVTVQKGATLQLEHSTVTGNVVSVGVVVIGAEGGSPPTQITGNIQINGGGPLVLEDAAVGGNVQIQGESANTSANEICASTIHGNLQVQNNSAQTLVGDEPPCEGGDQVSGNVQIQANTVPGAPAALVAHTAIKGNLTCQGGGVPAGFDPATTTAGGGTQGCVPLRALSRCSNGGGVCASSESPGNAFLEVEAPESGPGELALITFGPPPIGCSTAGTANAVVTYDVVNPPPFGLKKLVYQAFDGAAEAAEKAHPIPGGFAGFAYICFEGPESFTTATGAQAKPGPNGFYGELPECVAGDSAAENPPCVSEGRYGERYGEGGEVTYEATIYTAASEPRAGP